MSKSSKTVAVLVVYLILIAILSYVGHIYKPHENGAVWGGVIGVILSIILWFAAGKKYVNKS